MCRYWYRYLKYWHLFLVSAYQVFQNWHYIPPCKLHGWAKKCHIAYREYWHISKSQYRRKCGISPSLLIILLWNWYTVIVRLWSSVVIYPLLQTPLPSRVTLWQITRHIIAMTKAIGKLPCLVRGLTPETDIWRAICQEKGKSLVGHLGSGIPCNYWQHRLTKQGDKIIGSITLSVCLSVCLCALYFLNRNLR